MTESAAGEASGIGSRKDNGLVEDETGADETGAEETGQAFPIPDRRSQEPEEGAGEEEWKFSEAV